MWSGVGGGPKEEDEGLAPRPLGNLTSLQTHCATFYHIKPPRDPSIRIQEAFFVIRGEGEGGEILEEAGTF